jgi:hypothetical protein
MANPTDALSLIGDAVSGFAYIGGSGRRSIGTLIPDIVVSETHHDHLTITKHPVELGSAIGDHCYMEPAVVEMQCGASNSTAQSEGYVQSVYAQFLALQAKRKPFDVTTGKRQYSNMLISDIIVTTDETREYVLDFTVRLEKVKIVSTQTTTDNSKQANPAGTASPTNSGVLSLQQTYGVPEFAAQSNAQLYGASTVAPGALGSEITPTAPGSLDTGGVAPTYPQDPLIAPPSAPMTEVPLYP